jgi:hypothetical protein
MLIFKNLWRDDEVRILIFDDRARGARAAIMNQRLGRACVHSCSRPTRPPTGRKQILKLYEKLQRGCRSTPEPYIFLKLDYTARDSDAKNCDAISRG